MVLPTCLVLGSCIFVLFFLCLVFLCSSVLASRRLCFATAKQQSPVVANGLCLFSLPLEPLVPSTVLTEELPFADSVLPKLVVCVSVLDSMAAPCCQIAKRQQLLFQNTECRFPALYFRSCYAFHLFQAQGFQEQPPFSSLKVLSRCLCMQFQLMANAPHLSRSLRVFIARCAPLWVQLSTCMSSSSSNLPSNLFFFFSFLSQLRIPESTCFLSKYRKVLSSEFHYFFFFPASPCLFISCLLLPPPFSLCSPGCSFLKASRTSF